MKRVLAGMLGLSILSLSALLSPHVSPVVSQEKKEEKVRPTGYKPPSPEVRRAVHASSRQRHGYRMQAMAQSATPPARFDCAEMGWVLKEMGDQGNCGSCYLYATVEQVTECFIKAGYGKNDGSFRIATQYGMDCHDFGGCNGGWGAEVVDWMCKNGFPAEKYMTFDQSVSDYPAYEARSNKCRIKQDAKIWKPADWGFATGDQSDRPATVLEIKTAMMQYGVLNFALDAGGQFGGYSGGVIKTLGRNINHEITMVGWDDSKNAWRVRNQWSADWGEGGYGWIDYKAYITDVFWVTANPLPPPPVPPDPVPPGPVPPGPASPIDHIAVRFKDGSSQTFYPIRKSMTLEDIADIISGQPQARTPATSSTVDDRWKKQDDVNRRQDEVNQKILERLEWLQKQVAPEKK